MNNKLFIGIAIIVAVIALYILSSGSPDTRETVRHAGAEASESAKHAVKSF